MSELVSQINALLALKNTVPHPLPGLARELLVNSVARIEELQAALKPFAAYALAIEEVAGDVTREEYVWLETAHRNTKVTMSDFRRAIKASETSCAITADRQSHAEPE